MVSFFIYGQNIRFLQATKRDSIMHSLRRQEIFLSYFTNCKMRSRATELDLNLRAFGQYLLDVGVHFAHPKKMLRRGTPDQIACGAVRYPQPR